MAKHSCVICYEPLPRAQRTCGKAACLDRWRNLSDGGRTKHRNLATYTASERALIEASEPSPAPDPNFMETLREQAAAEQSKSGPSDTFRRSFLDPANLESLIKKEGGDNT